MLNLKKYKGKSLKNLKLKNYILLFGVMTALPNCAFADDDEPETIHQSVARQMKSAETYAKSVRYRAGSKKAGKVARKLGKAGSAVGLGGALVPEPTAKKALKSTGGGLKVLSHLIHFGGKMADNYADALELRALQGADPLSISEQIEQQKATLSAERERVLKKSINAVTASRFRKLAEKLYIKSATKRLRKGDPYRARLVEIDQEINSLNALAEGVTSMKSYLQGPGGLGMNPAKRRKFISYQDEQINKDLKYLNAEISYLIQHVAESKKPKHYQSLVNDKLNKKIRLEKLAKGKD